MSSLCSKPSEQTTLWNGVIKESHFLRSILRLESVWVALNGPTAYFVSISIWLLLILGALFACQERAAEVSHAVVSNMS